MSDNEITLKTAKEYFDSIVKDQEDVMRLRTKIRCNSVKKSGKKVEVEIRTLSKEGEDMQGKLQRMEVSNPDFFKPNKEYYMDFTEVE